MIWGHDFGTRRCLISAPIFIGLPTLSSFSDFYHYFIEKLTAGGHFIPIDSRIKVSEGFDGPFSAILGTYDPIS